MTRRDWLVLLIGFKGDGESPYLDPIRLQKGMFLASKEAGLPPREAYEFIAHNWGPYSRELRGDLQKLVGDGYVQAEDVPGYSWKRYALTPAGLDLARHLLHNEDDPADQDTSRAIAHIKRRVTGASFNKLLDEVYTAYPEYASNSLFRA